MTSFPKTLYIQTYIASNNTNAYSVSDSLEYCSSHLPKVAKYVLIEEGELRIPKRQFIPTDKETDPNG